MTSAQFIFDHGKIYEPGWPPKDMLRGKVGHCFDVCILNAACNNKYKYVEGYAEHPLMKGKFILHSWLTDGTYAFDPTWQYVRWNVQIPVQTFYVGFEMETAPAVRFFKQVEYAGIIANGWRDLDLAAKCLPGFPFEMNHEAVVIL